MNFNSLSCSYSCSSGDEYVPGSSLILEFRLLMRPINIETISNNCSFPETTAAASVKRFATRKSKHAAHSSAEPRAKSRKPATVCYGELAVSLSNIERHACRSAIQLIFYCGCRSHV